MRPSQLQLHLKISGGKTMTTTNTTTKTKTNTKTTVSAQAEVSRGAVTTMLTVGAIVGLWSLASLVGGLVVAGGPIALVRSWFGAFTGM